MPDPQIMNTDKRGSQLTSGMGRRLSTRDSSGITPSQRRVVRQHCGEEQRGICISNAPPNDQVNTTAHLYCHDSHHNTYQKWNNPATKDTPKKREPCRSKRDQPCGRLAPPVQWELSAGESLGLATKNGAVIRYSSFQCLVTRHPECHQGNVGKGQSCPTAPLTCRGHRGRTRADKRVMKDADRSCPI